MTDALLDLSGEVALVTGGNSGIGRAIALTLAKAGASVAILGRNEDKNRAVLEELSAIGRPATAIAADVSARDQLLPAVEQVERELGPTTILVNNAGTGARGGVLSLELADWDRVIETNLTAAFALSKYVAKSMVQNRHGKIINIASASVFYGFVRLTGYAVSKAGLVHLSECMAVELGPFNVQTNVIIPGWIETAMAQPVMDSPIYPETVALTPAGRWGTPQEVADTALYLASKASDFVNGASIVVDGGMTRTYGAARPDPTMPVF